MSHSHPKSRSKTRRSARSNPRGILVVTSRSYGFVQTAEGEYFIPESKIGAAFDGDLVEVAPIKAYAPGTKGSHRAGDKPTARVVRVVNRSHDSLVGRYELAEPFGVVVPEDTRIPYDIFTMAKDNPHVKDGDIVRVRIVEYPSRNTAATGVVEEVLGHDGEGGLDIDLVIAHHKLETRFSAASLEQAKAATVDRAGALAEGYRDIRDRFTFTVDPRDARDFDDALSIDEVDGTIRLGVHIADVSHYVEWGSSLDLDARRRATSVYLVDRVIPMLPEELSSDICSLKPHEVRRVFTVDMYLNDDGSVISTDFFPALIESKARLTYEQAQTILDESSGVPAAAGAAWGVENEGSSELSDRGLRQRVVALSGLAEKLSATRTRVGGIDFETTEARVLLDDEGAPVEVMLRKKTQATSFIEEAMILANNTVARYMHEGGFPCMYRVHEAPSADSLAELVPLLQEFPAYKKLPVTDFIAGQPSCLQAVLCASKGRPEEELVTSLVLRSMKRAVYKGVCEPHYGLASSAYTHFTSPIRRYPDLVVHRMLKARLLGKTGTFEQQAHSLGWLSEHSSEMERIAEKAARETQQMKLVEYMQRDIGNTFSGVISGVTTYGFFVRLENTAEGLVPMRYLEGEYFALDPVRHTLTGQDSGKSYRLGQRIFVVLESAEPRQRKLDFRPAVGKDVPGM
ncbi:MAG: ribonuclease R [Raoultibacter sp.]